MKRLVCIALAVLLLLTVLPALPLTASAESLYIRKIVSLVFDDSGSMGSDGKYDYANYALQAFCGMLNSEDQLFVTYMSAQNTPEKMNLSPSGIQDTVDTISGKSCGSGGTPFRAVETAYNKLKSVKDSNPNTQYWLVVITDGQFSGISADEMNVKIGEYAQSVMPNGTNPQITFLGIGGDAQLPNSSKGVYTYYAASESSIVSTMAQMADQISGRTRLQSGSIRLVDSKTVEISSTIPLLNIAVFAQGTEAKITKAVDGEGASIPIGRSAKLSYGESNSLRANAYLLGNSQTVIGAGTYRITFDRAVALENVVILYEPALEMRMTVTVNGKEITDYSQLDDTMEGDTISVSCKIYEMGTQREIDPDLLPPGTKFEITVLEDGKVAAQSSGKDMLLSGYTLKNIKTEIQAAVTIEGFNPIAYSKKFTPTQYVHQTVYTVEASFGSNVKSVQYEQIAANQDMTVCFTVYADGVAMTDVEAVKALGPVITVSPQGNDGTVTYSADGKIVFTPNAASAPTDNSGSFAVAVTCTLANGAKASESYTVEFPVIIYTVEAGFGSGTQSVDYEKIGANQDMTVCFTVYADGVAITDVDAVKALNPVIAVSPQGNSGTITYSADGKIVFTPNAASLPAGNDGSFAVEVTCTLAEGAKASETYTVLVAKYEVFAVNAPVPVKKTALYGNQVGVSFYITKDGVRLGKAEVEKGFSVLMNEAHSDLQTDIQVAPDGTITVTPHSDEEYRLTFGSWFFNWWHYWRLEGSDVEITLSHSYGNATAIVDIREESIGYILLNVVLPLVLEIAIIVFIVGYIYCVFAKPKFAKNAVLYTGNMRYDEYIQKHIIQGGMTRVSLAKFNKLKYRLRYTRKSMVVNAGGIRVTALSNRRIACSEGGILFKGNIVFTHEPSVQHPADIMKVCREDEVDFAIEPFVPTQTIKGVARELAPTNRQSPTYCVVGAKLPDGSDLSLIESGKIFVYFLE